MVINKKRTVLLACDFETTVYEGQTSTEVWSAAYARLYTDKVVVLHSIGEFIKDLIDYRSNIVCWFHNERFDGTFIVDYLLKNGWIWTDQKKMENYQFKTLISSKNRWYSITLKTPKATIEIRDSAKLMPMTLEQIGEAFATQHRKLSMEYEGYRYAGCKITKEEMEYIINDVLVLKEALEFMLNEGHVNLTIGSCALNEYKYSVKDFNTLFPALEEVDIDSDYGSANAYLYCRKAYKGAFCYVRKDRAGRVGKGRTFDVNSLYPFVMHSKSGNRYPIGKPHFWKGKLPLAATKEGRLFFIRFKCNFNLKERHLPTVQIKGSKFYKSNEWLESSTIYRRGKAIEEVIDGQGQIVDIRPELTMTSTDYYLFLKHYNTTDLEVLDGCWYYSAAGLFDDYIDKWTEKKVNAKTKGERTESKLFQNNLYGKFATSNDSSYQEPYIDADGSVQFKLHEEFNKKPGYIAVGAFITANARYYTITHGQENYDLFVYSDTDSLHLLDGEVVNIEIHPRNLGCWKEETNWSSGIFIRQKTYAEFVRKKDGEKVYPHWEVTCAGMPDNCKKKFLATHPITDFKRGLQIDGKLMPIRISGGIILKNTTFTLH